MQRAQSSLSPKNSFQVLSDRLLSAPGIAKTDLDLEHVQAILYDAFKNGAIQETIYGKDGPIAHESLCRPKDAKGYEYSIGHISQAFYDRGMALDFDTLTCAIGLKHAVQTGKTPITLNISVESALNDTFFDGVEDRVARNGLSPTDTIFEILEHPVKGTPPRAHLHALQDKGYRFALDDFSRGTEHCGRLEAFGDIVDYVKIDGPLVRAHLQQPEPYKTTDIYGNSETYKAEQFDKVVDRIQRFNDKYRDAPIELIAERVRTAQEALYFFNQGITGVQGRDLRDHMFNYMLRDDYRPNGP